MAQFINASQSWLLKQSRVICNSKKKKEACHSQSLGLILYYTPQYMFDLFMVFKGIGSIVVAGVGIKPISMTLRAIYPVRLPI